MHIIGDDSYTRLEPPPRPPPCVISVMRVIPAIYHQQKPTWAEISVPIITEVHIEDIVYIFLETLYFGTES
jgi:hypothetical protein